MLSIFSMIVSLFMGLVYTPFAIRLLGQSEYAISNLAASVISYLSILDLGFGNTLVRYSARNRAKGEDDSHINGLFLILYIIIGIAALLIGAILGLNIEGFFSGGLTDAEAHTLAVVFWILLANTVVTFPLSAVRAMISSHEKFIFLNGISVFSNILHHAANICFLLIGYKAVGLAVISLAFTLIVGLVNIYYCFAVLHAKVSFRRLDTSFYKEIFKYSFFILLNIIVDRLYASTDKVILGKLCGSAAVAVYGIGVTFEGYYTTFSVSISSVFLPHITKLSTQKDGVRSMSDTFLRIGHIQFLILSFIACGFIVFGQDFIVFWAGEDYRKSYFIALIIMLSLIIPLSQNIGISILRALNKHATRSVMYLIIAIINIGITIPLAMRWEGIGAAIGTAVGHLLGQILFMNWYYWKKIEIDIPSYWKQSLKILIQMIPVGIVFWGIENRILLQGFSGLLIKIVIGIIISAPYIYIFIMNRYEKDLVLNSMVSIRSRRHRQ